MLLVLLLLSRFSPVQLCDPIDGSPPGSPVPGILQARALEWVAISFSNAWKWKVKVKLLSRVRLFGTPLTAASRLLRPWDFPGKSSRVGCRCLLQIISSVQSLSHVRLFATPWIAARQASLSITSSRSSLRLTSIESVMPSSHLILCLPLLLLSPIPPSIRGGQSTGVSALASFLPKNTRIVDLKYCVSYRCKQNTGFSWCCTYTCIFYDSFPL